MKIVAVLALAALLSACQTAPPPKPEVVEVLKMVREPCIEKAPVRPIPQFGKGEMPDEKLRSAILIKDFEASELYGTQWEAAAAGCIKTAAANQLP